MVAEAQELIPSSTPETSRAYRRNPVLKLLSRSENTPVMVEAGQRKFESGAEFRGFPESLYKIATFFLKRYSVKELLKEHL